MYAKKHYFQNRTCTKKRCNYFNALFRYNLKTIYLLIKLPKTKMAVALVAIVGSFVR